MTKKLMYLVCSVVLVALLTGTTYGAIGEIWELGDDYSDVDNPNGPWSYRNANDDSLLLATPQVWGAEPDAWSVNGAMGVPWFFYPNPLGQMGADPNDDFINGGGQVLLRWESPVEGWINIDGTIWDIWDPVNGTWALSKNDVAVASGAATGNGTLNSVPFTLQLPVIVGDIIDLELMSDSGGSYVIEQITPPPVALLTVVTDPIQVDTIVPTVGVHINALDSIVQLTASRYSVCPEIYVFDHWIGDVADPNKILPQTSITMDQNKTVTAVFVDGRVCGDECHPIDRADLNDDCIINVDDFAEYANRWLNCSQPQCD